MKTVTFDEARNDFERVFKWAAGGETVVIQRQDQSVALQAFRTASDPETAPAGYFAKDYTPEEAAELNLLASQSLHFRLP
ncbi:MAG: type II toxin-antitoxin system Phd/YefM family antitoxin [Verrucomicrobia bacterium]|nr:type II toxin-antitoxin system Phd/YefM family antitoxin [Verrucomicrobiota bacterium]